MTVATAQAEAQNGLHALAGDHRSNSRSARRRRRGHAAAAPSVVVSPCAASSALARPNMLHCVTQDDRPRRDPAPVRRSHDEHDRPVTIHKDVRRGRRCDSLRAWPGPWPTRHRVPGRRGRHRSDWRHNQDPRRAIVLPGVVTWRWRLVDLRLLEPCARGPQHVGERSLHGWRVSLPCARPRSVSNGERPPVTGAGGVGDRDSCSPAHFSVGQEKVDGAAWKQEDPSQRSASPCAVPRRAPRRPVPGEIRTQHIDRGGFGRVRRGMRTFPVPGRGTLGTW